MEGKETQRVVKIFSLGAPLRGKQVTIKRMVYLFLLHYEEPTVFTVFDSFDWQETHSFFWSTVPFALSKVHHGFPEDQL